MKKYKRTVKRKVKQADIDMNSLCKLYTNYGKKLKNMRLELLHFLLTLKIGSDLLDKKEIQIEGLGKVCYESGVVKVYLDTEIINLIEGHDSINILRRLLDIC